MSEYKQINIRIAKDLNEQLRQLAFDKRTTKTKLVNKYIKDGLDKDLNNANKD